MNDEQIMPTTVESVMRWYRDADDQRAALQRQNALLRGDKAVLQNEIEQLRQQLSTDKPVAMNANQRIEIEKLRVALRAIRALDLSPNQPGKLAAARREIERLTRDALEGE